MTSTALRRPGPFLRGTRRMRGMRPVRTPTRRTGLRLIRTRRMQQAAILPQPMTPMQVMQ